MTAQTKVPTNKTVKVRGKRVGPSNVEAKRAAALRQAASAAENERSTTAVASTVSFLTFLREAAVTGVIPGNSELLATIDSWTQSSALSAEGLSPTGQRLVRDFKSLLQIFQRFLRERNSDELLQKFLHHVHLAGRIAGVDLAVAGWRARGRQRRQSWMRSGLNAGGRGKISLWRSDAQRRELFIGGEHSQISGVDVPRSQQQQQSRGQQVHPEMSPKDRIRRGVAKDAKALLRIAQMMITSTDFRSVLTRIQSLARKINDSAKRQDTGEDGNDEVEVEESIELVESEGGFEEHQEFEEQHKFGESRENRLDRELRELEREVEATSSQIHEPSQYYPNPMHAQASQPKSPKKANIQSEGTTEADTPIPTFSSVPALPIVEKEQRETPKQHESSKRETTNKQPVQSSTASGGDDELLQEMKEIFTILTGNKTFSRALRDFYFVVLRLRGKMMTGAERQQVGTETAKLIETDLRYDANFRSAQDELIQLMERLAGGASLNPVIENLKTIRQETRDDYELRDFFGDWRSFLKRCTAPTDGAAYIESVEFKKRGEFLLKRTRGYLKPSGQYRSHLDEAYDALDEFTSGIRDDKLTRQFGNQLTKLVKEDLIGVARGERLSLRTLLSTSSLLRPDLLNDVRFHILPRILKSMQSIPLPRIEIVSGGSVLVLEDVIVPADALVPMQLELITSSHVTMNPKSRLFRRSSTPAPQSGHRVEGVQGGIQLKLSAIAGQVRNVRFTLDRHESWPQFADQGLADLRIGGRGMSVIVDLISHPASEITGRNDLRSSVLPAALVAHRVKVRIDKLSLNLHDSLHDGMYRVFNPLISGMVKRQVEAAVRDQILNVVDSVDGLLDRLSQSVVNV